MSGLFPLFFSSRNSRPRRHIAFFRSDSEIMAGPNGFTLPPLGYAYNALEPYIDERTMRIHHDKHHRTYVNNLNEALSKYPELFQYSLEQLLTYSDQLPADIQTAVLHNGGGDYNHTFFWKVMAPHKGGTPKGELASAINRDFGSFDNFKAMFKQEALNVFGSGWTWLAKDPSGKLQIISTANQDTLIPLGLEPLIVIDVWEHAYYLKHQNLRADYIDAWFNVIDWDHANMLYHQ